MQHSGLEAHPCRCRRQGFLLFDGRVIFPGVFVPLHVCGVCVCVSQPLFYHLLKSFLFDLSTAAPAFLFLFCLRFTEISCCIPFLSACVPFDLKSLLGGICKGF